MAAMAENDYPKREFEKYRSRHLSNRSDILPRFPACPFISKRVIIKAFHNQKSEKER
jgi:hypothetical protein